MTSKSSVIFLEVPDNQSRTILVKQKHIAYTLSILLYVNCFRGIVNRVF